MDKLFSVTINESLTIKDAVDNLAETCGLTVIVKDSGAQHRMKKNLYYVKLKNASLKGFLDTLLKDNDLNYTLKGNKLTISYLVTKTYKIHYVTGKRSGNSTATINLSGTSNDDSSNSASSDNQARIEISTTQEFRFWSTIKDEIHRILNTAGDGSVHFTKVGNAWIGPDGQKWEYNPLEPVVNPEAGMVTVTGTARQLERVDRYIATLTRQLKTEVMIDVRILDVRLTNNKNNGIDWNRIYGINLGIQGSYTGGIGPHNPTQGGTFTASFLGDLTGLINFLNTQGDVTVVSSPKVMTLNNQPAMISVGREIYYEELSTNYIGDAANSGVQDVTAKSIFVGILLDITPEVDERGMITLRVNPSISTVDEEDEQRLANNNGNPTLPPNVRRRQIASIIKVRDGEHAVLGGLITKGKGKTTEGVPVLGNIPILGYAFKREQTVDTTDELVIIITPHIIRDRKNVSLKDLGYKSLR